MNNRSHQRCAEAVVVVVVGGDAVRGTIHVCIGIIGSSREPIMAVVVVVVIVVVVAAAAVAAAAVVVVRIHGEYSTCTHCSEFSEAMMELN